MKKEILTVISNRPVDALSKVYQMELSGCSEEQRPGQFVNIELDGLFLRRPISVCDWKDGVLTLLYKLVGKGTALMATLQPGARLDVLCSLGNGFDIDIPASTRPDVPTIASPLLVGGGIGTAPLYLLARRLKARGGRGSGTKAGVAELPSTVVAKVLRPSALNAFSYMMSAAVLKPSITVGETPLSLRRRARR